MKHKLSITQLGVMPFEEAWQFQKELFEKRQAKQIKDTLLLVEHPSVYTVGRQGSENDILVSSTWRTEHQVQVCHTDRGGKVTCHSPGQLVGYPILDLKQYQTDLSWYLEQLESILIQLLRDWNIEATQDPQQRGIWVGPKKIASIGVKMFKWVTMHGFALNVNNDLSLFQGILPCGEATAMTSMQANLNRDISISAVQERLIELFHTKF